MNDLYACKNIVQYFNNCSSIEADLATRKGGCVSKSGRGPYIPMFYDCEATVLSSAATS